MCEIMFVREFPCCVCVCAILCACASMCVCAIMCVYVCNYANSDRRCIVRNCPVASMASTLASTSPFSVASKRGPLGILSYRPARRYCRTKMLDVGDM